MAKVLHFSSFTTKTPIDGNSTTFSKDDSQSLTIFGALHLATVGGARVLQLDKTIGRFEKGFEFDAVLLEMDLDPGSDAGLVHLERCLHLADDRHVKKVWVRGHEVK